MQPNATQHNTTQGRVVEVTPLTTVAGRQETTPHHTHKENMRQHSMQLSDGKTTTPIDTSLKKAGQQRATQDQNRTRTLRQKRIITEQAKGDDICTVGRRRHHQQQQQQQQKQQQQQQQQQQQRQHSKTTKNNNDNENNNKPRQQRHNFQTQRPNNSLPLPPSHTHSHQPGHSPLTHAIPCWLRASAPLPRPRPASGPLPGRQPKSASHKTTTKNNNNRQQ